MDAVIISLFQVIDVVLNLFVWALIISIVMSWLVHFNVINPHNQFVSMVGTFLYKLTEPVLAPIRRVMPDLGGIDISPIIVVLIIMFIRGVLRGWMVSGF